MTTITFSNACKDCVFEDDLNETAYYQPGWQIALWAASYFSIIAASVVGNGTVIWIILSHQRMRTVTNYFIVNLALSELLMSALNTVFNFIYACHNVWYFGEAFCRFHSFVPVTAMFVSIYSMTAVAAERYMVIIYPFKKKLSAKNTKVIIGVIWLFAFGLAFPQFFYAQIIIDHGVTKCAVAWPHGNGQEPQLTYHIAVVILVYVLPLAVMFAAYSAIGVTLWHHDVPGDDTNMVYHQHKTMAKKRFVRAMIAVVVSFAICWFPYHLYFVLGSIWKEINREKYIQQVYLAVFWLAMSSAVYSPIIYCCLNHRFRSGFRVAFQWCPCIKVTERDRLNLTRPPPLLKMQKEQTSNFQTTYTTNHDNIPFTDIYLVA